MATNTQDTRPVGNPSEPTGAKQVAVYDQSPDVASNVSQQPVASMHDDPAPVDSQSKNSILSWVIGAIILIVLAFFLLQFLF